MEGGITLRTHPNRGAAANAAGKLLKEQLEVVKYRDADTGAPRYSIRPVEGQLTFDKGFYMFVRAIQLLQQRIDGVVMVGLAGPSGSGKTAFSEKVRSFIPGCTVLSMDNYNDASRLVDGNFDDPRLTDYDLLLENIRDLRAGKAVEVPIYDFKQSKRTGYTRVPVPTSRVVIVEGIYALASRIRPLLDLRVSIQGGVHFDLLKRVLRDIQRSGQNPEEIIDQVSATVFPMFRTYIEPDLKTAHLQIHNHFNPFSGLMNPIFILKSAQPVTKQQVKAALKPDHTSKMETETHDIYLVPPGEDTETCQSWIRMRNRDGRYNLMFEEWVTDAPFIISPRITFEVSVRILGGLMALGYEIGTIMKRTSTVYSDDALTVKLDDIEGMGRTFIQVQGKNRAQVAEAGKALGLDGKYIPFSYIEQVQLEKLTEQFQTVTDDMRRRFAVDGEPLVNAGHVSASSPLATAASPLRAGSMGFFRQTGFTPPTQSRPGMAASAPKAITLPPSRPVSNSSSTESTLTRELSRADLSAEAGGGAAAGGGGGGLSNGMNGHAAGHAHPPPQQQQDQQQQQIGSHFDVDPVSLQKLERAVQHIASRVDELALQPEVYSARMESQLAALASEQRTLQATLQQVLLLQQHGGVGAVSAGPAGPHQQLLLGRAANMQALTLTVAGAAISISVAALAMTQFRGGGGGR